MNGYLGPLYVSRHEPPNARADVVLAGPMSLERTFSYSSWVRLARDLASAGYCVWRFDYRGVGESFGKFEEQTLHSWRDDVQRVVDAARAGGRPVYVVGLRLGALLGQAAEHDGLVAIEPPKDGHAMLMEMLRRKLAADYAENTGGPRLTRDDYVAQIEAGQTVEVEGFGWSKPMFDSGRAFTFKPQPYTIVTGPNAIRIPKPVFWNQSNLLRPDLSALFSKVRAMLDELPGKQGRTHPPLHAKHDNREVVSFDGMVATVHMPRERRTQTGVLFLNFGYVPRDGHGGLAAHAASALSHDGVPAFRVDLPALGDSDGELPEHAQAFFDLVTSGGLVRHALSAASTLKQRYGLNGFVLGGLCGGAVSATLAAAEDESLIKALVLLEPEMYLTEPSKEAERPLRKRDRIRRMLPKKAQRLFSYWGWMRVLTLENRFGRFIPLPRKLILDLLLDKSALPSVTNVPLAKAWAGLVARELPMLVITADGKLREVFLDRINSVVLRGLPQKKLRHVRLKHTNHIFTTGSAIQTVISHIVPWSHSV